MPEIRQAIAQARALDGREDTEEFVLQSPGLLARLVQYLDLYVGHEPTLAEEEAYVRQQHRAETRRDAYLEAADQIEVWQNDADDAVALDHGALTDAETAAHVAVRRMAKALREVAAAMAAGEPARPAPRTRVLTQAFAGANPHLTIRLEFGPEYTNDGVQAITDRVRAAARNGLVEVTEGGEPRG